MNMTSLLGTKFAAGLCAIALSLAMIAGTVTMPQTAHAGTTAYVGILA